MEINITNEDCMELLARTPDGFYDLAIVDPPYGIGAGSRHMGLGKRNPRKTNQANIKLSEWDSAIPTPEYFAELFRVSKNQIICGGNYFPLPPTRGIVCWDKGLAMRGRSFSEWEFIWTSFDRVARLFYFDLTAGLGFITNGASERETKIHPTQKPIALYEWLLRNYAKPGQTILDTHMGSGSIAIACYNQGFDLTACELDTDYCNAAMKRIEAHIQKHPRGEDLLPKRVTLNNQLPLEFFTQ
jgi:site-specific DNA-methyltransferase (adenine-specific)